jgi:hypothetical protein
VVRRLSFSWLITGSTVSRKKAFLLDIFFSTLFVVLSLLEGGTYTCTDAQYQWSRYSRLS